MNNLKFATRRLLKNPGFTTVALFMLALGIGPNTAARRSTRSTRSWRSDTNEAF